MRVSSESRGGVQSKALLLKLLQRAFPFGQWVCAMDHPIKCCGTTDNQYPDYSGHTHQFDYVAGLEVITLPGSKNLKHSVPCSDVQKKAL